MSLQEQIKAQIKEAMLAKEATKLEVVRGIVTACMNELVATGRTPQEVLSDDEVLKVITRISKQRKDSIDQYQKAGREDLVKEEQAQLTIIEAYLPKLMTRDEILPVVQAKKEALGIVDKTKSGQLVGMVMKDLAGKADGMVVKEVVESLF